MKTQISTIKVIKRGNFLEKKSSVNKPITPYKEVVKIMKKIFKENPQKIKIRIRGKELELKRFGNQYWYQVPISETLFNKLTKANPPEKVGEILYFLQIISPDWSCEVRVIAMQQKTPYSAWRIVREYYIDSAYITVV